MRKRSIAVDECIQTLLQNPLGRRCRDRDIDNRLQFRLMHDLERATRDVASVVSDAFDVSHNLHCRCNETEIGGNWLFARENLEADIVDFELESVDLIVFINDTLCE